MGELRIVSHSEEPFVDREEAGRLLARELMDHAGRQTVVLGIPRGGVIVARQLALVLDARMDVVLSRKIGAPGNPELAIGAISEDGRLFITDSVLERLGRYEDMAGFIERERERQYAVILKRIEQYRSVRPKEPLEGKTAIVTDDGLATGATMEASVWAIRRENPAKLIVAVPVASIDSAERVAQHADQTVVLHAPPVFYAVGQFYEYFSQVADEEVMAVLQESLQARTQ
ncbi:MAG TPA: phosphoribosyltransferase family protein [Deltaproteobacteria bacterium]|jgi:predicted phosphoribosyltransferase|nr:phosphoribosyltransferase family protein [Deltaproteobacteria bacterium]HOI07816.1 phosphoribosyltransferase family protein [Deltaproteobacteria bacterium]